MAKLRKEENYKQIEEMLNNGDPDRSKPGRPGPGSRPSDFIEDPDPSNHFIVDPDQRHKLLGRPEPTLPRTDFIEDHVEDPGPGS